MFEECKIQDAFLLINTLNISAAVRTASNKVSSITAN